DDENTGGKGAAGASTGGKGADDENTGGKGAAGASTGGKGADDESTGGKGTAGESTGGKGGDDEPDPNAEQLSAEAQAELSDLKSMVAQTSAVSYEDLAAQHEVAHAGLSYDPTTAEYLDLINASALALSDKESAVLESTGFVISEFHHFCSFYQGFDAIYVADLPVYVSADSILEAVHRSYDDILKQVELAWLVGEVGALLEGMRQSLAESTSGSAEDRSDVDLYLGVALSLLTGSAAAPVAGASAQDLADWVAQAEAASGIGEVELFGQSQMIDWSQFKPRGHYEQDLRLQRYFRAMIWLGRTPLRIIATASDGSQAFMRRQFDDMLLMTELMGTDGVARWEKMEQVLSAFVGESDNMTPGEVTALLADLGVASLSDTAAIDDAVLQSAILKGGYGAQRIASQMLVNDTGGTLPLDRAFMLFGQRYVVDSNVFSNVVYDRVGGGQVKRMMPDPLDVAYAALGNDDALPLLEQDLTDYAYAPDLEAVRLLVDAHGEAYWQGSLYTRWIDMLRALSPSPALARPSGEVLPAIVKTEPWSRRILNTQLGSWAELRHDTLLYAKQSYTGWPSCEYPDAYVDPYPEFYTRLAQFAEKGIDVAGTIADATGQSQAALSNYFSKLQGTATMLADMAVAELTGAPFTEAQLTFVNNAVRYKPLDVVCAVVDVPSGWYVDLFFSSDGIDDCKPTIADVHTQPADEGGNPVGRVLHVGTGYPRMMVTTVDTCTGPKAYVGVVFAYHERITDNFQRLTDSEWLGELSKQTPPDVAWMQDLVVR
ncbi:MAG: DUF3160 domain-containing protein, partial [Polyangiaceae bacterium]|nr:DUF3160 domain-containing protein [Polyangiaceae bacterium]